MVEEFRDPEKVDQVPPDVDGPHDIVRDGEDFLEHWKVGASDIL